MLAKHPMRDKLVDDFNAVVAETEQMLKAVSTAGSDTAQAARANIERSLESARRRLREVERATVDGTRAAARATDQYVHVHPWQTAAVAAGVGLVAGLLAGLLFARRGGS